VGQLSWEWFGPLDPERFVAAWQSVHERESVLRASFDEGAEPGIAVRQWVTPELVRLPSGAGNWPELVARDRERALDPRRPGPARVTLLEEGKAAPAAAPTPGSVPVPAQTPGRARPHRMLLTYHHALLDDVSARLLLREFFRAYLDGGRAPGGERRPDIGDYGDWLAAQDLGPAREFWSKAAPPVDAADFPVPSTRGARAEHRTETRRTETRRTRHRLTPGESGALRAWAGGLGATEFGALQAAWALLLHRASGADAAAPVAFSVSVSGRGIPLDSVDRLPGALWNPLPVSVLVDPELPVPRLLAALGDRALDAAAYEWVSAGQIGAWAAPGTPQPAYGEAEFGGTG
ncbi:condensation domain-containing protein, partial [Streptomyces boluensis]